MSSKPSESAASEQYQEIKQSLKLFPYFETWDETVIDECCRLSSIKEYSEDSIILGSHSENSYMTFFVLEGICKIIHHLQVQVKVNSFGKTTYKLYHPTDLKSSTSDSSKIEYTSMLFNEMHKFQKDFFVEDNNDIFKEKILENDRTNKKKEIEENEINEKNYEEKNKKVNAESFTSSEKNEGEAEVLISRENIEGEEEKKDEAKDEPIGKCNEIGTREQESQMIMRQDTQINQKEDNDTDYFTKTEDKINSESESVEKCLKERHLAKYENEPKPNSDDKTDFINSVDEVKVVKEKISQQKTEIIYDEDHHLKILEEIRAKAKQNMRSMGQRWAKNKPKDVKNFFFQVGLFYKGSCFGLEEHLKDTVVMSETKVKCLTIPRRFLFLHNPCNIWNRIRLFFSLHLPTEEQIVEYFSSNRQWLKKKEKMSEQVSSLKKIPNYTLCSDVPYAIRLLQEL